MKVGDLPGKSLRARYSASICLRGCRRCECTVEKLTGRCERVSSLSVNMCRADWDHMRMYSTVTVQSALQWSLPYMYHTCAVRSSSRPRGLQCTPTAYKERKVDGYL